MLTGGRVGTRRVAGVWLCVPALDHYGAFDDPETRLGVRRVSLPPVWLPWIWEVVHPFDLPFHFPSGRVQWEGDG